MADTFDTPDHLPRLPCRPSTRRRRARGGRRRAGTQFDPAVVDALGRVLARHEWAHRRTPEELRRARGDPRPRRARDLRPVRPAPRPAGRVKGADLRGHDRARGGAAMTCADRGGLDGRPLVVLAVLVVAQAAWPGVSDASAWHGSLGSVLAVLRRHRARRDGPADGPRPGVRPHRCPPRPRWGWRCRRRSAQPGDAHWAPRRGARGRPGHGSWSGCPRGRPAAGLLGGTRARSLGASPWPPVLYRGVEFDGQTLVEWQAGMSGHRWLVGVVMLARRRPDHARRSSPSRPPRTAGRDHAPSSLRWSTRCGRPWRSPPRW